MGIGEPGGRLFVIVFGAVFTGFALLSVPDAIQKPVPFNAFVVAVMLAGALWMIGTGIVGVPMRAYAYVGGGPGFRRVKLQPDEPIITRCWGAGEPSLPPSFWDNLLSDHWSGEFFLTDRRLVLVTWRWQRWIRDEPALVWLRLADIADVRDLDDVAKSFMGMRAREIVTHAGQVYYVWLRDPDFAAKLRNALTADAFPEVKGLPPGSRRSTIDRLSRNFSGVLAAALFAVLAFGQTSWPYVGGPRRGFFLVFLFGAAVVLYDLVAALLKRRQPPHIAR